MTLQCDDKQQQQEALAEALIAADVMAVPEIEEQVRQAANLLSQAEDAVHRLGHAGIDAQRGCAYEPTPATKLHFDMVSRQLGELRSHVRGVQHEIDYQLHRALHLAAEATGIPNDVLARIAEAHETQRQADRRAEHERRQALRANLP